MNDIILLVIQGLWFSLPMYVANMMPVLVKSIPFLNIPIDLGKSWRGKPIFGSHKTFRGFVFGVAGAVLVVYIQSILFSQGGMWREISIVSYTNYSVVLFGFLLGFGSLAGDAVESFIKRRISIKPGGSWYFFDQVDYIIGALLFCMFIFIPSIIHIIAILILGVFLSFFTSYIGYYLGLKDSKV